MLNTSIRGLLIAFLLALILSPARAQAQSAFCSDPGCKATRQTFRELCDYIVANKGSGPSIIRKGKTINAIFIAGYYMRTLVAGYEILGDQRYLDTAIAYGDTLLKDQMPSGYWATGYGPVYFADTGSALGLFIVLYKHVDRERQKRYLDSVQRYVDSLEKDGMLLPNGALGVGWEHTEDGKLNGPIPDKYTISSALTGGEIFTWMYYMTKKDQYRRMAYNSLRWIFTTMRKDGVIPYVLAAYGSSLEKHGDPRNDYQLWDELPYLTAAYVGEGLLSFDIHSDQAAWNAELRKDAKPMVEWLLSTQNANGSWSHPSHEPGCRAVFDLTRTPGIANTLIWYYNHVDKDPRVLSAVKKFDQFLLNPEEAKEFGQLNQGAAFIQGCNDRDTATSLTGYAFSDILVPGISSRW
ncbi:MAG: hypothetical protein P4N24_09790 [Acidobacteriota bacterium]|nr:hypothetical protein [Acidobacteriota bacterium]